MLETRFVSPDGRHVLHLRCGQHYRLRERLAVRLVQAGYAVSI